MNPSDIHRVEKNIISPDNSSVEFGFSKSHPIITFTIPNQNKFLVSSSLRLQGRLNISTNGGGMNNKGNISSVTPKLNGTIPNNIGVSSLIQSITINSTNNTVLERIQNYGRFVSSMLPVVNSSEDYDSSLSMSSLCASRSLTSGLYCNRNTSFSTPLYCGMFMGTSLVPISNTGTRGLRIQIELNSDAMALCPWLNDQNERELTEFQTNTIYSLTNITLSYDQIVPTESAMATPSSGSLSYNSITNLYSVIRTNDETLNLNLSNTQTVAIYHNFIPSVRINNILFNSFETMDLMAGAISGQESTTQIRDVSQTKGSLRFPLDYELITRNVTNRPLSNLLFNYVDSIHPINRYNHSTFSVNSVAKIVAGVRTIRNALYNANQRSVVPDVTLSDIHCFGIGANQDYLSRIGVSYKNTPYNLRVQSDNSNTPNSVYTYTMSKNMLGYNTNGISVMN